MSILCWVGLKMQVDRLLLRVKQIRFSELYIRHSLSSPGQTVEPPQASRAHAQGRQGLIGLGGASEL